MQNTTEKIKGKLPFVHLRLSSEYSLTEGILPLEEALELAEQDHMPALALTDNGNIFGAVKFAKKALKIGLKENHTRIYSILPIIGSQLYIQNKVLQSRQRVIALVKNITGYYNLCQLLTNTYINCKDPEQAAIEFDQIVEKDLEGLFILSGHLDGDLGNFLLADQFQKAKNQAQQWQSKTKGSYFIELQKARRIGENAINDGSLAIAEELGIPIVATHPILFAKPEDYDAHEVRYCIAHNENFKDSNRPRPYTPAQYFTTSDDMHERFIDYPQSLINTINIAKSCDFIFDFLIDRLENKKPTYHLPSFTPEDGSSAEEFLIKISTKQLITRLIALFPNEQEREKKAEIYQKRLQDEIITINEMGFAGYYLVVQEIINWAKSQKIPVGPGRGSGAGSITAYVLGITDIDPITNGLLFERFLNKERISMPDFDIDFCEKRRNEVIDFIRNRHGSDRVASIVTYVTMAARAVIKDCGRAMGVSLGAVTELSELIPREIDITLEKAHLQEPEIIKLLARESSLNEVWQMALKLEGLPRNIGAHAAGILITPKPVLEYCPLYQHQMETNDLLVSQFDMKDIESLGLVKFDALGLATLTIIENTQKLIKQISGNPDFSIADIDYQDLPTYQIFQTGKTNSVFQCESQVCKELAQRIKIENFEEITALMGLNRPGPLGSGMVDNYINVKHNIEEIKIFDQRITEILQPTYGAIIYQEQVMKIAQVLANYSLGEADILRRAMGKKDEKLMAQLGNGFIDRAKNNQTDPKIAEELFNLIQKFAEYGFNKSHAAAYGLLAYQTAYLKVHYPSAFLAAVMSSEVSGGSNNKIARIINDCKQLGIKISPPSINDCEYFFIPKDNQTIYFGMGSIKGVGEKVINHIIEIRQKAAFNSFDDFINRVDRSIVNKKALEALIKSGAFDSIEVKSNKVNNFSRQYYLNYIENSGDSENEQNGELFGNLGNKPLKPITTKIISSAHQDVIWENEVLDFSWSGHLIDYYQSDIKRLSIPTIEQIAMYENQESSCWCAGIIAYKRMRKTRKGQMLTLVLDDNSSTRLDLTIFDTLLSRPMDINNNKTVRNYLQEGNLIFVYGKVRQNRSIINSSSQEQDKNKNSDNLLNSNNNLPSMQAEHILTYDDILLKALWLSININNNIDDFNAVKDFILESQHLSESNSPNTKIYFCINRKSKEKNIEAFLELPNKLQIAPSPVLTLREKLGLKASNISFSKLTVPSIN